MKINFLELELTNIFEALKNFFIYFQKFLEPSQKLTNNIWCANKNFFSAAHHISMFSHKTLRLSDILEQMAVVDAVAMKSKHFIATIGRKCVADRQTLHHIERDRDHVK